MALRTMIAAAVAVLLVLCISTAHASVTISGYAFLADEGDHRDIKVLFEAASPSAVTDSVTTDSAGYFQIGVEVGMYTITYSKEHHLPETLPTRMISEDTILDDVTLRCGHVVYLSGDLSGTLSSGDVCIVTGDIYVQSGDTLIIEPGVTVKFDSVYVFEINGLLKAVGTEADSILFTSNQPTLLSGDWTGIQFKDSADDSSRVEYCRIEYAERGISCSSSSSTITHNTITGNSEDGICCESSSSPTITHNTITRNSGYGIRCGDSSPTITYNTIAGNSDGICCVSSPPRSSPLTPPASVSSLTPSTSLTSSSSPTITHNTITGNSYGIYCKSSSPTITHNTITGNSYGILFHSSSSPAIINNTITGNSACGIRCYDSSSIIANNIVVENYQGISCEDNSFPSITYNDVWGNFSGNFIDCSAYMGELITVNANGDSCDTYFNIIQNPLFRDSENGDICLRWGSPCIDAGDPTFPLDPDTTVADIGAVPFDQRLRDIIPPSVPQDLSAVAGDTTVSLTFSANPDTEGVAFYVVYRDTTASPADSIAAVLKPNTTYFDLDVEIGKTYYYRITAVDSAGNESEYSNEVSATLFITPEPPSNLLAFDTPDDQGHSITLTWTESPDDGAGWGVVSYYRIYRSRSSELTAPIPISAFPWSACPDTFEFSPDSCPGLDSLMAMEVNHTILIDSVTAGTTEYVDAFVPVNGVSYYYWLDAVAANDGMSAKVVARFVQTVVNEETTVSLPQKYLLYQNSPNPFNPSTTIRYQLSEPGDVSLTIYDVLGQKIRVLVSETQPAGRYRVRWDGKDGAGRQVSTGAYLYRLMVEGEFLDTRKMMLVQ